MALFFKCRPFIVYLGTLANQNFTAHLDRLHPGRRSYLDAEGERRWYPLPLLTMAGSEETLTTFKILRSALLYRNLYRYDVQLRGGQSSFQKSIATSKCWCDT